MKICRREDSSEDFDPFAISAMPPKKQATEQDPPPQVQLYSMQDLFKLEAESRLSKDDGDIAMGKKLRLELAERGQMRDLMTMNRTYVRDLDKLRAQFPNFSEVIDYIHCCAEIAWRTDKVLKFTPLLLNGPGGVGKTMFTEALGTWMNHGFHRVSVSSSQNGSDLAGSSSFWSNSKPGIPFTALLYSDYANPLIFLDEIDKNTTSQYDALGALYVLLEPATARTFKDQSTSIPFNCAHVLYVACSNQAENLPEPLLSRFKRFDLSITAEQSRTIAESIVHTKLAELMPATEGMSVSAHAMDALATMTPRRIGQAITEAIGTAFINHSTVIDVITSAPPKRRIGFLA